MLKRSAVTSTYTCNLQERLAAHIDHGSARRAPLERVVNVTFRALLFQGLRQAERHVSEGERRVAKQEALVAKLDQHGHDTGLARAFLQTLQTTQALHVRERDRILRELELLSFEPLSFSLNRNAAD